MLLVLWVFILILLGHTCHYDRHNVLMARKIYFTKQKQHKSVKVILHVYFNQLGWTCYLYSWQLSSSLPSASTDRLTTDKQQSWEISMDSRENKGCRQE